MNGDGTSLQYTANSIAYFANVIIDITGHGVSDTCNKVIRIPAATEFWELGYPLRNCLISGSFI